jgi:hypothetical protein
LSPDFTKAAICYRLRKMVIFQHARDMQVLDADVRVAFTHIACQLVNAVFPAVSNTGMKHG